jgi:hypothetical protein
MAGRCLRNLQPGALVHDAARLDLDAFLRQYGRIPLLLVRVSDDDAHLMAGLENLWPPSGTRRASRIAPMAFRTDLLRAHDEEASAPKEVPRQHDDLLSIPGEGLHFAVVIRGSRRASAGLPQGRRVSLGRAANNGVVLRHPSVSKFHAWLEPTDDRTVMIVDPGSTNGTSVNDVSLRSRAPVEARSRDRLRFGDVEAVLWSPHALWRSQHAG